MTAARSFIPTGTPAAGRVPVAASSSGNTVWTDSPHGVLHAALGDSLVAGGGEYSSPSAVGADLWTLAPGWFTQACIRSNQRMAYAVNAGVDGNTSTQALARVQTDVIDYGADRCIVAVGENDHNNSISASTTISNLAAIYAALEAANVQPVPATILGKYPGPYITTTELETINHWIRTNAHNRGWDLLDFASFMLDPATGKPLSAYAYDYAHPNYAGYKAMADYVVTNYVPRLPLVYPSYAVVNSDSGNLLSNGCMLTDSNADGMPEGWTHPTSGTSTVATTLPAAPSGSVGNAFTVTCTGAGTQHRYLVSTSSGFSAGDKVLLTCKVVASVLSGSASWGFVFQIENSGGTVLKSLRLTGWPVDVDGGLRLPLTVPATATKLVVYLHFNDGAQGTGSIKVSQISIRNLTVEGLA